MMQASCFGRLSFDPFALLQNGFVTSEVAVRWREVVQALVEALMVVVIDEGFDLRFEITWQKVVFEQDAVLQSLMPSLHCPVVVCLQAMRGILPWVCG